MLSVCLLPGQKNIESDTLLVVETLGNVRGKTFQKLLECDGWTFEAPFGTFLIEISDPSKNLREHFRTLSNGIGGPSKTLLELSKTFSSAIGWSFEAAFRTFQKFFKSNGRLWICVRQN